MWAPEAVRWSGPSILAQSHSWAQVCNVLQHASVSKGIRPIPSSSYTVVWETFTKIGNDIDLDNISYEFGDLKVLGLNPIRTEAIPLCLHCTFCCMAEWSRGNGKESIFTLFCQWLAIKATKWGQIETQSVKVNCNKMVFYHYPLWYDPWCMNFVFS